MTKLKQILTNGFFILVTYLMVITSVITVIQIKNVLASDPTMSSQETVAPAEKLSIERDITQQRFAPLETGQK